MPARIRTNDEALSEAAHLQEKTKDAVYRIQQQAEETEQMGMMTLDDLYERRRQMDAIEAETNKIHETLDDTEQMQRKLGSFFGWLMPNTSKAMRQVDEAVDNTANAAATATSARKKKTKKLWKKAFHKTSKPEDIAAESAAEGAANPGMGKGDDINAALRSDQKEQLKKLEEGDQQLDDQLDALGLQLQNLTALAEEIGGETKLQTKKMRKVNDNMIDVHVRQYEATERTRKFIGDARHQTQHKEESIVPKPSLF